MSLVISASLPQNGSIGRDVFKCDICAYAFRTSDDSEDRKIHILQHFQQMFCTVCQQTLIRIGDTWYSEHSGHNLAKTEPNIDDYNERNAEPMIISHDFNAISSNDGSTKCRNQEAGNVSDPIFCAADCDNNSINPVDVFKEEEEEEVTFSDFIELKPEEITHNESTHQDDSNEIVDNQVEEDNEASVDNPIEKDVDDTRNKPFGCASCDKSYATRRTLINHINKYNHRMPEMFYTAKSCKRYTKSSATEIRNWKCKYCNVDFEFEISLAEHIIAQHRKNSKVPSVLRNNSTASRGENTLEKNQSSRSSINPEDLFSDDSDANSNHEDEDKIETEQKAKTGEKRLICDVCNKELFCRTGFKYHMNLHLGIKPYACDQCDKAFTDKRHLNKHKKSHLPITHELNDYLEVDGVKTILTEHQLKLLVCPICNKRFYTISGLKCHVKVHETPKFKCKICDKVFSDVSNYKRHRSISHKNVGPDENMVQEEVSIRSYGDVVLNSTIAIDWICEYCNGDFEFEIRLAKHIIKEHSDEKTEHLCNICDCKFSQLNNLLMHMRAHPESVQHKCTFDGCEQGFAYKSSLMLHIDKHNRLNGGAIQRKTQQQLTDITKHHATFKSTTEDTSLYTCNICSKECANRTGLLAHIQGVHSTIRVKCPVSNCDRIFKSDVGLTWHVKKAHPDAMKMCDICNRSFCSEEKLAKHQLCHNRTKKASFICNVCEKAFATKSDLRCHLSTHEKQAECNICGEKFSSVTIMLQHRERHGKKKVITCRFKGCNQVFENRREFIQHTNQHPSDEKKKFICSYCGKAMASMSYLRDHINIHTGKKPFECKECKKCFAKTNSLRRHLLIHTGEKPYICDIGHCNQAYRDSIDLKRHKFSAHKIYTKKHICPICNKVFSERKLLTKHTSTVHSSTSLQG
ncbi:zinc finger protein 271-like [Contarinia nasturtii]|uniref:zinc finger protein 271-like n=1 Tax=Contarinia nasturtii TaxID=265458 RepID=UPI0012D3CCC3|nr:zinc finger protein 271-like [Contarinia nasturtii]